MQLSTVFGQRRAVLISGGVDRFQNHDRYLNDLAAFYSCLRGARYNFAASDIQVLFANGGVHSMASDSVTAQDATSANVKDALHTALQGNPVIGTTALGPDDLLVIFTTNHGDSSSRLLLWGAKEYLTTGDFATKLSSNSLHQCLPGRAMTTLFYQTLAAEFLRLHARGVIGAQIDMPAVFAGTYALRFFEAFLRGSDANRVGIGPLMHALTQEFLNTYHNPLGLVYSLYRGADCSVRE